MHAGGEAVGVALALAASLCWSIAALLYRAGMSLISSPLAGNWARCVLALPVMLLVALATGVRASVLDPRSALVAVVSGLLIGVVGDGFYLAALRDASVSLVYPVAYTYIVVASAVSVLALGEKATVGLCLGVVLSLAGVYLASRGGGGSGGGRRLRGVLEAVLASLSWGFGVCAARVASELIGPLLVDLVKLSLVALVLSPFPLRSPPRLRGVLAVGVGGVFGVGVGDWLYYASMTVLGASRASVVTTMSLPLTLLLARLLLGEKAGWRELLAAGLIGVGVLAVVVA